MTVAELIEQLSAFEDDIEVVTAGYDAELCEINTVVLSEVYDETGTVVVTAVVIGDLEDVEPEVVN